MDRTLACEAENLGSTPNERTKKYHPDKIEVIFFYLFSLLSHFEHCHATRRHGVVEDIGHLGRDGRAN